MSESNHPKVPRRVRAARHHYPFAQLVEATACCKPLWKLALRLDALIDTQSGPRPPHGSFEALLFEVAAQGFGSYRSVDRFLADEGAWNRLRSTVKAAHRGDLRMRLPEKPITRGQHDKFRKRLTDQFIEMMHHGIDEAAVKAAQSMGMLVPGLGSSSAPDMRSLVAADGCWMSAERCRRPVGLLVPVVARNPHDRDRVVISARARSVRSDEPPPHDATVAVDTILDLVEKFPHLRDGLKGVVYDRMLDSDSDRLLDAGIIPLTQVPRDDRRLSQARELRNDCELLNWQIKRSLGRTTYFDLRIEFKVIAFQAHALVTALIAHHDRTGADMTPWFGQHQLPTGERLLA